MRFSKTLFWSACFLTGCSGASFDIAPDMELSSDSGLVGLEASSEETGADSDAGMEADTYTGPDSAPTDSGTVADSVAIDTGHAVTDTGTVAVDTGSTADTGTAADTAAPSVAFSFPQSADPATNTAGSSGTAFSVGYCRYAGDRVDHVFTSPVMHATKVGVSVHLDDQTQGCAIGKTHAFAATLDGVSVGTLSFTTTVIGPRIMSGTFSVNATLDAGEHLFRLTAADDVCTGGGSWAWQPGGKVTIE